MNIHWLKDFIERVRDNFLLRAGTEEQLNTWLNDRLSEAYGKVFIPMPYSEDASPEVRVFVAKCLEVEVLRCLIYLRDHADESLCRKVFSKHLQLKEMAELSEDERLPRSIRTELIRLMHEIPGHYGTPSTHIGVDETRIANRLLHRCMPLARILGSYDEFEFYPLEEYEKFRKGIDAMTVVENC